MNVIAPRPVAQDKGTGWLPDRVDIRDYTKNSNGMPELLERTGVLKAALGPLPSRVDLRSKCSPIVDQGHLGSCTANAAAGVLEYFELQAFSNYMPVSRLFIYKATRDYLQWSGDSGAFLRSTMGALSLFGAPPERFWPYHVSQFDVEPTSFCYSFASNYQALTYYRLDPPNASRQDVLADIKAHVAAGLPAMFGFPVYASIYSALNGEIPYPAIGESTSDGHAIVVVGYDDDRDITNPIDGSTTRGAMIIRNSWGADWGEAGYGYMPYQYVLNGLAQDFWVLVKAEYLATGNFDISAG
ncbi:C1 family peptidase [Streptomyces sp. NPDC006476]|uniref:C1 family peptidase n=1 Tax=Streptomyces sp. NPDC006476 TaxID=3157175 RepID=UPI0033B3586F